MSSTKIINPKALAYYMLNYNLTYILTPAFILALLSCDRTKKESHKVVTKAKETVSEKKSDLVDKIIRHYNPYNPDTKFNRKRFSESFMFEPTAVINNLYCYADEMGIDHDCQFSFNCDTTTINKIIFNLNLKKGIIDSNNGRGFWRRT